MITTRAALQLWQQIEAVIDGIKISIFCLSVGENKIPIARLIFQKDYMSF